MTESLHCPMCKRHIIEGHVDGCQFGAIEKANAKLHADNAMVHRAVLDHCKRADMAEADAERLRTAIFTCAMGAETTSNVEVIRNMLRAANDRANPKLSEPAKDAGGN